MYTIILFISIITISQGTTPKSFICRESPIQISSNNIKHEIQLEEENNQQKCYSPFLSLVFLIISLILNI